NGEDAGNGFLPRPGTLTAWRVPGGPGIRVDSGVTKGSVIGGAFDSLLAKLVVTGATRAQALARARRALAEFVVEGLPTVLPFHRAVVVDPAFAPADPGVPFTVHTRWIEEEFAAPIAPWTGPDAAAEPDPARETVVVEVGGKRLEVVLPAGLGPTAATTGGATRRAARRSAARAGQ